MNESLEELFPDGDFRFHLTLRRSDPREFMRPRDSTVALLAERARWLESEPTRYADVLPEGNGLVAEFSHMVESWKFPGIVGGNPADARSSIHGLGRNLEPDVLLLSADAAGQFRLRGGALCFPTGWALEEKLGQTMDFIHGGVPGLNAALASPIQSFLSKLKPGVAFLRDNWGIAATDALNLHPARAIAPPRSPVALDRLWLRVEHQALFSLPRTGGIVFAIRIALYRFDALAAHPVGGRVKYALGSIPEPLAVYKRIDGIRKELISLL